MRYGNRVGNWIIWPDGRHRKMWLWERILWLCGRRVFHAYILRNLGIPKRFRHEAKGWTAEGPFTKPSQRVLDLLEKHGA